MSEVLEAAQNWTLTPLQGGPLWLPLERFFCLARLVGVGFEGVPADVRVGTPDGNLLEGEWERTSLEHELEGKAHIFSGAVHSHTVEPYHRLGVALKNACPPAGTPFELASHDPQASWTHQRYVGTVEGESLLIVSTYPALDASTLRDALELFAQAEEGASVRLASEEVAASVFQAYEESMEFAENQFLREGALIKAAPSLSSSSRPGWLSKLAGYAVLRTPEFARAWDLHEALRLQEKELADAASHSQALRAQLRATRGNIAGAALREMVLAGKSGDFMTASLTELPHVIEEDERDQDALMAELGFSPAGGLLSTAWFGSMARGYVCQAGDPHGLVRVDSHGRFTLDFRSSLQDGSEVLTSTRADEEELRPAAWLRYTSRPSDTPAELLEAHRRAVAGAAAKRVSSLEDVAAALDSLEVRSQRL